MSRRSAAFYYERASGESNGVIISFPVAHPLLHGGGSARGMDGRDTTTSGTTSTSWTTVATGLSAPAGDLPAGYMLVGGLSVGSPNLEVIFSDAHVERGAARQATLGFTFDGDDFSSRPTALPVVTDGGQSATFPAQTIRQRVDSYLAAHPGVTVDRWRLA